MIDDKKLKQTALGIQSGGTLPKKNPDVPEITPKTNGEGASKVDTTDLDNYLAMLKNYGSYTGTNDSRAAQANLQNYLATAKPQDWTGGQFGASLQAAVDKINNREPFAYDMNADALYQQYKDQYMNQGKLAMQNTMGQAAAMTGGYGNSYANSVGNQAYQGYLNQLNDKSLDLYSLALDRYNSEGNQMAQNVALLQDQYNTEYGQYRDRVNDYNNEVARLTDAYNTAEQNGYSRWANERNFLADQANDEYTRVMNERNMALNELQAQRDYDIQNRNMALKELQNQQDYDLQLAKLNADSSDAKTTDPTLIYKNFGFKSYGELADTLQSLKTNTELDKYLTDALNAGLIDESQAQMLYNAYEKTDKPDLNKMKGFGFEAIHY